MRGIRRLGLKAKTPKGETTGPGNDYAGTFKSTTGDILSNPAPAIVPLEEIWILAHSVLISAILIAQR